MILWSFWTQTESVLLCSVLQIPTAESRGLGLQPPEAELSAVRHPRPAHRCLSQTVQGDCRHSASSAHFFTTVSKHMTHPPTHAPWPSFCFVLSHFLQEWNISRLSYEYDSEPFGKERDAAIKKLASEAGVEVTVRISHTLYDLDKWVCVARDLVIQFKEKGKVSVCLSRPLTSSWILLRIIELNGGQSPLTYKRFQTLISRMEAVEVPADSITAEVMGKCTTPLSDDHDDKFGVPSLEELGELQGRWRWYW